MKRVTNRQRLRAASAELVRASHRMQELGYVTSSGGNLSCRIDDVRIIITPTGRSKGGLRAKDLVVVNPDGTLMAAHNNSRPSSEAPSHLCIYRERCDVRAVVHAHPPVLTGFALAGTSLLEEAIHPEVAIEIGPIASIEYVEPAGDRLAAALADPVHKTNAILLRNHGVVLCSPIGPLHAVALLELLETFAYSCWIALTGFGTVNRLSERDLVALDRIRRERGVSLPGAPGEAHVLQELYGAKRR